MASHNDSFRQLAAKLLQSGQDLSTSLQPHILKAPLPEYFEELIFNSFKIANEINSLDFSESPTLRIFFRSGVSELIDHNLSQLNIVRSEGLHENNINIDNLKKSISLSQTIINEIAKRVKNQNSKLTNEEIKKALEIREAEQKNLEEKLEALAKQQTENKARLGLSAYMAACNNAIKCHQTDSVHALIVFGIASVITIWIILWLFTGMYLFPWGGPVAPKLPLNADIYSFISYATGRVAIASFVGSLCIVTSRLYLTHQHNIVTLRHQYLAGQALLDFLDANDDSSSRNIIVTECVKAICNREPTGFLRGSSPDAAVYSNVAQQLIQALGSQKS